MVFHERLSFPGWTRWSEASYESISAGATAVGAESRLRLDSPPDSNNRRGLATGARPSLENDVESLLRQGSSLSISSNAIVLSSPRSHKWRMVEHMSVPDVDAAADSISSVESIAQTKKQARPSALFGLARFFFALAVF